MLPSHALVHSESACIILHRGQLEGSLAQMPSNLLHQSKQRGSDSTAMPCICNGKPKLRDIIGCRPKEYIAQGRIVLVQSDEVQVLTFHAQRYGSLELRVQCISHPVVALKFITRVTGQPLATKRLQQCLITCTYRPHRSNRNIVAVRCERDRALPWIARELIAGLHAHYFWSSRTSRGPRAGCPVLYSKRDDIFIITRDDRGDKPETHRREHVAAAFTARPAMPDALPMLAEPLLVRPMPPTRTVACRSAVVLIGSIIAFTAAVAAGITAFLPPSMASLGVLAYCFGARHGVDADHIAAIDNVTRNLIASGQRPISVGLFFSLGHCLIVFALCGLVIVSSQMTGQQLEVWASAGSTIGPWVSVTVLIVIGSVNLGVARDLHVQWRNREARGHAHEIASLVGRCCPSCLAAIDRPWKVCYLGLLFGLGLDTAAEIGLLTLSALAQPGVVRACALVLPALFAAGMALVDSLNGLLMLWAYEWAAEHGPMSRLYFSLFLTAASATLALLVGAVEALGQVAALIPAEALRDATGAAAFGARLLEGARWLSDHLEVLGAGSVALFSVAIVGAVVLAPYCTVGQAEIDAAKQATERHRLRDYLQRGEYIVRVE